jgi:predicted phosphate transport protein (TIGR00153 family)
MIATLYLGRASGWRKLPTSRALVERSFATGPIRPLTPLEEPTPTGFAPPSRRSKVRAAPSGEESPMTLLERLMPKTDSFFSDFEAQAAAVVEGSKLLKNLLDDFTDVPAKIEAIKVVEHRADDITHRAFARLHTQFITPFDRAEIHRLLSCIDDVLDLADGAAQRIGLYDIDHVLPEARELATVLVAQTEKMAEAVSALRNVKKDPNAILQACKEINVLENQADTLTRQAVAGLFRRGGDPLTVIKWKEIINLIELATDRVEDVANVIEGVVLEHA